MEVEGEGSRRSSRDRKPRQLFKFDEKHKSGPKNREDDDNTDEDNESEGSDVSDAEEAFKATPGRKGRAKQASPGVSKRLLILIGTWFVGYN
jgi:hypothetical protein